MQGYVSHLVQSIPISHVLWVTHVVALFTPSAISFAVALHEDIAGIFTGPNHTIVLEIEVVD